MAYKAIEAKDVKAEEYEHFGGNLLPKGCLSILAGSGGAGKSVFMCYLAERLCTEGRVAIVSNEEEASKIKTRLSEDAKITIISFSSNPDNSKLTKEDLLDIVDNYDIVFFDSLITISSDGDLNKASSVESLLSPFISKLAGTNKALMILHHTNKGNASSLKDMVSGSERVTSGVRHCKVLIWDERGDRRFLVNVKDNTGLPWGLKYELLSEKRDEKTTVFIDMVPTEEDMDKIVYLNSEKFKIKMWEKEYKEEKKEESDGSTKSQLPPSLQRVLKSSNGEDITPNDIISNLGEHEYIYFTNQLRRTGNKWVTKTKNGRQVTYHWTEEAIEWLREQDEDYPF